MPPETRRCRREAKKRNSICNIGDLLAAPTSPRTCALSRLLCQARHLPFGNARAMDWTRSQRGAALGLLLRVLPVSCFGPHVSHIKQLGFSSSDRCSAAGMASLVRGGSRTRPAMPRTHAHSDEPPQLALHSLAMPQDGSTIRNFDETLVKVILVVLPRPPCCQTLRVASRCCCDEV